MTLRCVTGYVVGGLLTFFGCALLSYPIIVKLITLDQNHHIVTNSQTGSWVGIIKDPLVFPFIPLEGYAKIKQPLQQLTQTKYVTKNRQSDTKQIISTFIKRNTSWFDIHIYSIKF